MTMFNFPKDFLFGTATSSYQIEGAVNEGGRTPCLWDYFCSQPEKIYMGHTGETACDHYHRYKEDIDLMASLGIQAYRFSIAWPRIYPEKGKVNKEGIDFYKELIAYLKTKNILPMLTINHWDLPLWAFEDGGFENRESVKWFVDYADTLFKEFGDDIHHWITHNEPFCITMLGYMKGIHAPGVKDIYRGMRVAHHLLLSHGEAVKCFRRYNFKNSQIGITLNLSPAYPFDENQSIDREMARRADGFVNRWFLDPLFKSKYPEDMAEVFESRSKKMDFIEAGDLETISEKCDFFGINYYQRNLVKPSDNGLIGYEGVGEQNAKTLEEWQNTPMYFYKLLKRIEAEYTKGMPIYITENGLALTTTEHENKVQDNGMTFLKTVESHINDQPRIDYVQYHLEQCQKFIQEGGNLKGYFIWSLMDNFEWALGYSMRFGMIFVNFETQERILKESALWYRSIIESNIPDIRNER